MSYYTGCSHQDYYSYALCYLNADLLSFKNLVSWLKSFFIEIFVLWFYLYVYFSVRVERHFSTQPLYCYSTLLIL